MTRKNEVTDAKVRRIAGMILAIEHPNPKRPGTVNGAFVKFTWDDIRAVAASCLAQPPFKPISRHADFDWIDLSPRKAKPKGKWTARKISLRGRRAWATSTRNGAISTVRIERAP